MSHPVLGTAFVTGATGLLGSELVSQLLKGGEASRVVCLVRDSLPQSRFFTEGLKDKVVVVSGDIRDAALLDRVINEYEVRTIFHLAAQTLVGQANARPTETLDVNVRGTWALLEAARINGSRVRALLLASSDKAYGNLHGEAYDESCPLQGRHPYDVSKSAADLIAQAFAVSYGLNVCITRCGNFFGPGDLNESRIFPSTILAVLRGERPIIRSDGKYIRDYLYVGDGANAYIQLARQAVERNLRGEAFNFSYGIRPTVLDIVKRILTVMDSRLEPIILNEATNEIPVQCLESHKARNELGWAPKVGFDKAILETISWYRDQYERGIIR